MPIGCSESIVPFHQDGFHSVDRLVMRHAFDIHNELGRFLDEKIYQNELARRCENAGLCARREVAIDVSFGGFNKRYLLDLLLEMGVICELKVATQLTSRHESQLIHYLLLLGQQHGKLINFRSASVESRFVSTRLTESSRRQFQVDASAWRGLGEQSQHVEEILRLLLQDWGAFLALELYKEALWHFLGGKESVVQAVDVLCDGVVVGSQSICLLDESTALHLSAVSRDIENHQKHLIRLLYHTRLEAIQWINFGRDVITFRTVMKKK